MSSGYDEMEVISTMDISDKEHNSIDNIEEFIHRKYANRAECNPFLSPTFEFPPGHRIRICNFVKEVKKLRESCESDKNVRTRKRGKPIVSHVHPKSISPGSLQILHVNGNHWIAISTLDSDRSPGYEVTVPVYDSLNGSLSKETKALLAKLLKTTMKRLLVKFGNTAKQAEFDDCGLFAAAYCTTLAYGQNPSSYVYDQSAMRKHLINCLEAQHIEPFPIIRERRIGTANIIPIEVFCYCRNTDDGTRYVVMDAKNGFILAV